MVSFKENNLSIQKSEKLKIKVVFGNVSNISLEMCWIQILFFLFASQITKIYMGLFFSQMSVLGREGYNVTNTAAIQNGNVEFSTVKWQH